MRRWLASFGLQLLSVALALVLWFLIAGQKQAERSVRVAVEFQNVPESLEIIGEPPSFADVRVRGPASGIGQLRTGDLIVLLDLATARPGRRLFHLTPDQVVSPTGVRVLQVLPASVALTFDASITRKVPVVPVTGGMPAPGYVVRRVVSNPPAVEVTGPESAVRELAEATTEPIDLNGATKAVREAVAIGLANPQVRLSSVRNALVTVEIEPAPIERLISGVPIQTRGLGPQRRARVTPHTVTVTAHGPATVVRQLSPVQVPLFIDLSGLRRGRYNLPVQAPPGADYSVSSVNPSSVRVVIR
jgi:YbbR domain-containing protein